MEGSTTHMHIYVELDDSAPRLSTTWWINKGDTTEIGVNARMTDDQIASEAGRTVEEVIRRLRGNS